MTRLILITPLSMPMRCICGCNVRNVVLGRKRWRVCPSCGALCKIDLNFTAWVRIPEDSIEERRANGKRVILRRPQ
jgi:hypothetical protein